MRYFKSKVFLELHLLFLASSFLPALCKVANYSAEDPCSQVEIVSRKEWNAMPEWRNEKMKTPVNKVIIEHTASADSDFCRTKQQCSRKVEFIQEHLMDERGLPDIGYQFMVGGDGRIYEGRGWDGVGSHTINFNFDSIGIAFLGNFNNDEPTQKMLDATLNLIACGVRKGYLTPTREIYGHRDVLCTESPGNKLYAIIRTWENFKGGRISKYTC